MRIRNIQLNISFALPLFICAVLFLSLFSPRTLAAPNLQINYQGKLTDTANLAVPDGTYNMRFWLLTSPTAATTSAVWTESLTDTNKVEVTNGLFSIMLGSTSPLTSVDFNQTLYLGVEIGGSTTPAWDGEMSPRKIIGAVPAAFEADRLDGLTSTQFARTDATSTIATTSADTLFSIIQNGTGGIFSLFDGNTEVFSVLDGGFIGIGTSSPTERFSVAGNAYIGGNVTATGTLSVTGLSTFGSLIATNGTTTNATSSNLSISTSLSLFGDEAVTSANALCIQITGSADLCDGSDGGGGGSSSNWLLVNGALSPSTTVGIAVSGTSTLATTTVTDLAVSGDSYFGGNVGIGSTTPGAKLTISGGALDIQGTSTTGTLGAEMITAVADRDFSSDSGNWTGTNWAIGSGVNTHSAGNNALTLSNSALTSAPVAGRYYQVTFTINTTATGTPGVSVSFGGTTATPRYGVNADGTQTAQVVVMRAVSAGTLTITPNNATWTGTIDDVSIKEITVASLAQVIRDSNGTAALEFRAGGAGLYNTFMGKDTGFYNTTGQYNTAQGIQSLFLNTIGSYNTAQGMNSLYSNTTGYYNTAVGYDSLTSNTSGQSNTAQGYRSLSFNTSGEGNTAQGTYSLYFNTTGNSNTAQGIQSLFLNTTGDYNTAQGRQSLNSNTTGDYNTAQGIYSLYANTTGAQNTAQGGTSLYSNITGVGNSAQGFQSLYANTTGDYNTAQGNGSLFNNITGSYNTAAGVQALYANTTGINNTAVGNGSLFSNLTGENNAALGYNSLNYSINGSYNSILGSEAGYFIGTSTNNTIIGYQAGLGPSSSFTSTNNTIIGYRSGYSMATTTGNLYLGYQSAYNSTGGDYNILLGYNNDLASTTGSNQLNIGNLLYGTNLGINGSASTGNIGIGTSSPSSRLTVQGGDVWIGGNLTATGSLSVTGLSTAGVLSVTSSSSLGYASSTALTTGNAYFTNATATNLYSSGTFRLGSDLITDLTGAGLTVTGNALTVATSTFFTNSTQFAQWLDDETGTGNAVFSASPTFTGTAQFANASSTNASTTNLSIHGSVELFGGGAKTTANALCIQITGSADLCDGSDGGGAGGSSNWTLSGSQLTPSTTVGIAVNATSTLATTTISDLTVSGSLTNAGVTWTARSAAATNQWQSITYGNGLFVAVSATTTSTSTAVMASSDGVNWTARAGAEANSWTSVAYGNGLFVAISSDGANRVMTSPDGINWTARSAAGNNDGWYGVTYGNDLFVAVGQSGDRVMTSPDGINWTARSAAGNNDAWRSVIYGNGLFVAVGSSLGDRIMTSPDGINWTARSAAGDDDNWREVTYGNGLFVVVGTGDGPGGSDDTIITSPDGINWTTRRAAEGSEFWTGVTYGNGLFVAVGASGDLVVTSLDGINWTARSAAGDNDQWESVTYGNGLFVAVGGFGDRVMTSGKSESSAFAHNNIFQGGMSILGAAFNIGTTTPTTSPIYGLNTINVASTTGSSLLTLSNAGYLGIGSTTPGYLLTAAGDAYIGGNLTTTGTLSVTGLTTLGSFTATNGTTTNASSTNLSVSGSLALFGNAATSSATGLCIIITGSADLCDGSDGGGAGGSSNWTLSGSQLTPSTTVGIAVAATSTLATTTVTNLTVSGTSTLATTTVTDLTISGTSTIARLVTSGTSTLATTTITDLTVSGHITNAGGMSILGGAFNIGTTTPITSPLYGLNTINVASTTGASLLTLSNAGSLGLGSTTPQGLLTLDKSGISGDGVAGMKQYFQFTNSVESAIYFGDHTQIVNAPTATSTLVGKLIRIEDDSVYGNTVRALEVQAHRGTNTKGENTAINAFGRTFGIKGTTEGDAGDTARPAGVFAETRGTTQGNALRAYSGSITTESLVSLYQQSSDFAGVALSLDMGNAGGTFNTPTSKFFDLKKAGTSLFSVLHTGDTAIGTSTSWAKLSIMNAPGSTTPLFDIATTTAGYATSSLFTVLANGNVGIGTSSPSARLDVWGSFRVGTSTSNGSTTIYADASLSRVGIGTSTLSTSTLTVAGDIRLGTSGTNGCVQGFGGATISGTCASDERLKTGVTDLSPMLSKLAALRVVNYNWNEIARDMYTNNTDELQTGYLAQNVEELFPELVETNKQGFKVVNYSALSLYAIKGVSELAMMSASTSVTLTDILTASSSVESEDGSEETFWSRLGALARSFVNGVLRVTGVRTEELCVGNVCVDEAAFLNIVENGGGGTSSTTPPPQNSEDVDPEPAEPVEPPPTEDPLPDESEQSTSTPTEETPATPVEDTPLVPEVEETTDTETVPVEVEEVVEAESESVEVEEVIEELELGSDPEPEPPV